MIIIVWCFLQEKTEQPNEAPAGDGLEAARAKRAEKKATQVRPPCALIKWTS